MSNINEILKYIHIIIINYEVLAYEKPPDH